MSRLEIPGYYFDEQKGKYFKIEKAHLAPSSAAWSSDNVKRKKVEDEAQRTAEKRKRLLRNHVRRHKALNRDDFTSGLLDWETGVASATRGLSARVALASGERTMRGQTWARGLESKGDVPFAPSFARRRMPNMGCFWVDGGDEGTGLGVAYGCLDEETLVGSYIPTDENERISFSVDSTHMRHPHTPGYRREVAICPQMSSIKYHAPSNKMILTSTQMAHQAGISIFSPTLSPEGTGQPRWLISNEVDHYRRTTEYRWTDQWTVHTSTPAPASLPGTLCVVGTNAGILHVSSNENISLLASTPTSYNRNNYAHYARKSTPHLPRAIFSLDFQLNNPHVLFAGGRQPRLWRTDLRTEGKEWSFEGVPSSIAHAKSLNEREVLAAGPKDFMAVYDVRNFGAMETAAKIKGGSGGGDTMAKPVLTFPEHKNEAHIHTGLDVSHDLGLVATGQGDGTVKLFSTTSGRPLKPGGGKEGLSGVKTDTPIKALMFQKMPWERWESLWVGEGPALRKFSFGSKAWDDEV